MRQLRWTVPEKAFWQINSDGRFDQVIAISAYRIRDRGNEYLTGLKFSYQSGYTSTIGCTDGRPCSEAYFEDGERLVILEVLSDYHGTLDIVVSNQANRTLRYILIFCSFTVIVWGPGRLESLNHSQENRLRYQNMSLFVTTVWTFLLIG